MESYLRKLAAMVDNPFGRQIRSQFADLQGSSELAMLASPTAAELEQLSRAVAIMTPPEKENAHTLDDSQVRQIADDARIDPAILAIFLNGYALQLRKTQGGQ